MVLVLFSSIQKWKPVQQTRKTTMLVGLNLILSRATITKQVQLQADVSVGAAKTEAIV